MCTGSSFLGAPKIYRLQKQVFEFELARREEGREEYSPKTRGFHSLIWSAFFERVFNFVRA